MILAIDAAKFEELYLARVQGYGIEEEIWEGGCGVLGDEPGWSVRMLVVDGIAEVVYGYFGATRWRVSLGGGAPAGSVHLAAEMTYATGRADLLQLMQRVAEVTELATVRQSTRLERRRSSPARQ
jgi:hypothetical protein